MGGGSDRNTVDTETLQVSFDSSATPSGGDEFIITLGGLALLTVLKQSFIESFNSNRSLGALITFLITISDFNLFNIGAPFCCHSHNLCCHHRENQKRLIKNKRLEAVMGLNESEESPCA